jgi:ankyrin repeat protein
MPDAPSTTLLLERHLRYYDDRAGGLLEVLPDGAPATLTQVRAWHPGFADASDEELRSAPADGRFTLADARLVYAREHGFGSWDALAAHVERLASGELTEPFVDLLEAGRAGNWNRVTAVLSARPELIRARATNGNSLLSLACGMVPCKDDVVTGPMAELPGQDRLAPVRYLLAAGADPNQPNDRGWTPLHDAGYRGDEELVSLLLEAGAGPETEAHGAGGTPLAVALFWGNCSAADRLAPAGVLPRNLRVAAGLGRLDLVDECFDARGHLTPAALAGRGFYRPHSGFPAWRPSDNPQEVLDEALVWAAKSDRTAAMAALLKRGARVDADPYRGTPLLWAAYRGRVDAAGWLLDHGADANQRATFGGPGHGDGVTALHLAAQNGELPVIDLLLARGADRTIRDRLYDATPFGWARHSGLDIPALDPQSA